MGKMEEKIKFPKYAEIKISNMVVTGKFLFKKFLCFEEIEKLIDKSYFGWDIVNQETTPQLSTYIIREDQTKIYFQLWHTGKFYMTGLQSEKEVKIYFREILKELKKLVPKCFNGNRKCK